MKMLKFDQFTQQINEAKGDSYGCLMLNFEVKNWEDYGSIINDEDLHEYGIETEPHVTVLYGFGSDISADNFKNMLVNELSAEKIGQNLKFTDISLFENEDFDVLKFDAESSRLRLANLQVRQFPHVSTHPQYHPHLTLAYVKPGTGETYQQKFLDQYDLNLELSDFKFVYSDKDNNKTEF